MKQTSSGRASLSLVQFLRKPLPPLPYASSLPQLIPIFGMPYGLAESWHGALRSEIIPGVAPDHSPRLFQLYSLWQQRCAWKQGLRFVPPVAGTNRISLTLTHTLWFKGCISIQGSLLRRYSEHVFPNDIILLCWDSGQTVSVGTAWHTLCLGLTCSRHSTWGKMGTPELSDLHLPGPSPAKLQVS